MHGLEAVYWGQIDFIYIDREDPANADVVSQYSIRYQPVLVLIAPDGSEVQRWTYIGENEFRAALDAYLVSSE